jgi:integrase
VPFSWVPCECGVGPGSPRRGNPSPTSDSWNRNRGAVTAWLSWCTASRLPAPVLPASAERRREHINATRAVPRPAIDRTLSRRDVPLREKTLWRMLYETAARASEVLALNIEDLDLDARRAPIRSKGGDTE